VQNTTARRCEGDGVGASHWTIVGAIALTPSVRSRTAPPPTRGQLVAPTRICPLHRPTVRSLHRLAQMLCTNPRQFLAPTQVKCIAPTSDGLCTDLGQQDRTDPRSAHRTDAHRPVTPTSVSSSHRRASDNCTDQRQRLAPTNVRSLAPTIVHGSHRPAAAPRTDQRQRRWTYERQHLTLSPAPHGPARVRVQPAPRSPRGPAGSPR